MKRIFISGPMNGYKKFNFDHFDEIEEILKNQGYIVVNPATISKRYLGDLVNKIDKEPIDFNSFDFDAMIKEHSEELIKSDAMYLLKGWQNSIGAKNELLLALKHNKEIILE